MGNSSRSHGNAVQQTNKQTVNESSTASDKVQDRGGIICAMASPRLTMEEQGMETVSWEQMWALVTRQWMMSGTKTTKRCHTIHHHRRISHRQDGDKGEPLEQYNGKRMWGGSRYLMFSQPCRSYQRETSHQIGRESLIHSSSHTLLYVWKAFKHGR